MTDSSGITLQQVSVLHRGMSGVSGVLKLLHCIKPDLSCISRDRYVVLLFLLHSPLQSKCFPNQQSNENDIQGFFYIGTSTFE